MYGVSMLLGGYGEESRAADVLCWSSECCIWVRHVARIPKQRGCHGATTECRRREGGTLPALKSCFVLLLVEERDGEVCVEERGATVEYRAGQGRGRRMAPVG